MQLRTLCIDEHLTEREVVLGDPMRWPMKDLLLTICSVKDCAEKDRFLIGQLKPDYELCPGSWDFLTNRARAAETEHELARRAMKLPSKYTDILGVRMIGVYDSFVWPDVENKMWWNILPFRVEPVETAERIVGYVSPVKPNPDGKYEQLYWAAADELRQYDRLDYLATIKAQTIDRKYRKLFASVKSCPRCEVRRS